MKYVDTAKVLIYIFYSMFGAKTTADRHSTVEAVMRAPESQRCEPCGPHHRNPNYSIYPPSVPNASHEVGGRHKSGVGRREEMRQN